MNGMIERAKFEFSARFSDLESAFGIKRQDLQYLNIFLQENLIEIATENLQCRCRPGHSCSVSSFVFALSITAGLFSHTNIVHSMKNETVSKLEELIASKGSN